MPDDEVELRLLGPVRVRQGGVDRPLGSGRRAAVLVVLALAGEATREQLVAAVWGDDPPPSANGNVYTHVNALRSMLGGRMLTLEDGVYRLRATEGTVDVRRFEALRRRRELAALDEALDLWDGDEALAGVPGPYADVQRARLRELRRVTEQRLDLVRAVAFLGPGTTLDEVTRVTGRPAAVVAPALGEPALGRELYERTPETLRAARHEFFAQLIADSFGPPERVAAQLLRAGPAPLSPSASRWLLDNIDDLAQRSSDAAVALLRRAHLQHLPDPEVHVALSVWLARLLHGQGRDAVAEAGWVAARTADPEIEAEMLWIAARSHDRAGRPVAAADIARSMLGRREHARPWLDRFRRLVLGLRLRLPGVPTEPRHNRSEVVSDTHLSAYRGSI